MIPQKEEPGDGHIARLSEPPDQRDSASMKPDGAENVQRRPRQLFESLVGAEEIHDQFVVPHLLVRGGMTLFVAEQDFGKSILSTHIGARLTRGEDPFDFGGGLEGPGTVLYLACEDDDPRVRFLGRWRAYHGDERRMGYQHRLLRFPADAARLSEGIERFEQDQSRKADLVVIDPVLAYTSGGDSNSTSDVRAALDPLQAVASEHRVALLAVAHPRKGLDTRPTGNLLDEAMGSAAWTHVARVVLFGLRNPEDRGERWISLEKVKTLGDEDRFGMTFRFAPSVAGIPHIEWGPRLDRPVQELRRDFAEDAAPSSRDATRARAAGYLEGIAAMRGELRRADLESARHRYGLSERTQQRALKDIGARYVGKDTHGGRWEVA